MPKQRNGTPGKKLPARRSLHFSAIDASIIVIARNNASSPTVIDQPATRRGSLLVAQGFSLPTSVERTSRRVAGGVLLATPDSILFALR